MMRGVFGAQKRDVLSVLDEIGSLENISLPEGKKRTRQLGRIIGQATQSEPVRIYVGSCPDYSHESGLYTHESLNNGVPLLTQRHLEADSELLRVLDRNQIPFRYTIMVADVEADDPIFCQKFTNGNRGEFLTRCRQSQIATRDSLDLIAARDNLDSAAFYSSSFFEAFGENRFLNFQRAYQTVLLERHSSGGSFRTRVAEDILARMSMYTAMYGEQAGESEFLVIRTLRTMAQYLTLGKLISEIQNSVIISHPTRNIGMFNERNNFRLPGEIVGQQLPVPVLVMNTRVY